MAKSKSKGLSSSRSLRRILSIIAFAAIIIAIPLTVAMSQRQQATQQQAAGTTCGYAFNSQKLCETYNRHTCQQIGNFWRYCPLTPTPTPYSRITPVIGHALTYCSRCSDTYKYCHVAWQSTQSCTDTQNARYAIDCSCTQGTIDCGLKGLNTSACAKRIAFPTNNPVRKTFVSLTPAR